MKYAQGILRAVLLAVIVALSYAVPTPVLAQPEEECPEEVNPGEHGYVCSDTQWPGICRNRIYLCTESGWEAEAQCTGYCDEVCGTWCEL
jgi:hypothetical protein